MVESADRPVEAGSALEGFTSEPAGDRLSRSISNTVTYSLVAQAPSPALRLVRALPLWWVPGDARQASVKDSDRRNPMKKVLILGLGVFIVLVAVTASAQSRPTTPPAGQGTTVGPNFVDNNGDGICDNFQAGTPKGPGQGRGRGYGRGMGNGTHVGPQDGTGFGRGAQAGGGTCDGTGPKGRGMRRGAQK